MLCFELLDSIPGATGQDLKYRTGRNMGSGAQIPRLKACLSHLSSLFPISKGKRKSLHPWDYSEA